MPWKRQVSRIKKARRKFAKSLEKFPINHSRFWLVRRHARIDFSFAGDGARSTINIRLECHVTRSVFLKNHDPMNRNDSLLIFSDSMSKINKLSWGCFLLLKRRHDDEELNSVLPPTTSKYLIRCLNFSTRNSNRISTKVFHYFN